MKGTLTLALVIVFCMLVIPLSNLQNKSTASLPAQNTQSNIPYQKDDTNLNFTKIRVLSGDSVNEYSAADYVFGVVAAEMPALYHEEALKAQAVAAYTFACYKMNNSTDKTYDISADAETAQCFITREQARTNWGDRADEYENKINDCISAVSGQILVYKNLPIFAAYHAISPGVTNSSLSVWGKDLPYLQPCDSFGDKLANGYLTEATFTADQLAQKLSDISGPVGDAQNYFTDIDPDDNGYIKSITYCGKKTTGAQISKALSLRSSCFEVAFADGSFKFTVKGYGHGVGLSQTGADYMAKQGSTYDEILSHYYKDATLQKS